MSAGGAKNVLNVLSEFSPNVEGHAGDIDPSNACTTALVSKAPAS